MSSGYNVLRLTHNFNMLGLCLSNLNSSRIVKIASSRSAVQSYFRALSISSKWAILPCSHGSETGSASGIDKPTTQQIINKICPHCSRCWNLMLRTQLCTCTLWGSFLENKGNLKFELQFTVQTVWGMFISSQAPILSSSSMSTRCFDCVCPQ
jgi:hypothetical protein